MFEATFRRLVKRRDRMTLGQQVALVTALLCLALVATVAGTAAYVARQQAMVRVESAMVGVAANVAQRLDTSMFERFREIGNIARLAPLEPVWLGDPAATRDMLEQLQSTLPDYAWIGFALPDGTVKAATGGLLEGVSVAERPWFTAGAAGPTVQDVHDAKLLSELLRPPGSGGEPIRFVDIATPVRDAAGSTIGVLGAHMNWTWAADIRQIVLEGLDPSLATEIWVLARDGKALLGPEFGSQPIDSATIARIGSSGFLSFRDNVEGGHMLGAVVTPGQLDYPGLGWIVVARRPLDLAVAPANQLTLVIALIGVAFAVLGVTAATVLSRRLTRPLQRLAASIDSIGRDSGAVIPRDHSSREASQLSVSIRSLLRRLGSAETAQEAAAREAALNKQLLVERTERLGEDINALQTQAETDPLTGLLNRRAFRLFGTDAMNYFKRHKRKLGVLVIDIDFFKRINDTYGRSVGDDVIRSIGQIVQAEARTIDKVARFGGEEFVVLLRETEKQGPAILAERIRARVADQLIDHPEHGTIHVTVSIGAALASVSDRDIGDLVERADRGLYRAKAMGRNCVVVMDADKETPQRGARAA